VVRRGVVWCGAVRCGAVGCDGVIVMTRTRMVMLMMFVM
jgi:hypothetical protein